MTDLDAILDRIEEKQKVEGQILLSTNGTSLDFLQAIYRDPNQPIQRRMRAASAALPFEHAKLGAVALVTPGGDFADRLTRALEMSRQVKAEQAMKVIEAPKPVETTPEPPPDHSKPFAHDNKSRWRRF